MSLEKPTILLIPGAWHLPDVFDDVRASLALRDFPSVAVALPSIGAEPPSKGLTDDVIFVQNEIKKLSDEGKKIVVVAHSYGGMVGADAVKGMGYAERKKDSSNGGVLILVYLAAFVAKSGTSLLDMLGGKWLPWMQLDGNYCKASMASEICYHDLSEKDQENWNLRLVHTSRAAFEDRVSHEPWHNLPCMYVFCEEDRAIPISVQESMAGLLGDYSQYRCNSSHSPFLSMPEKVAEACEMAGKIGLEKIEGISMAL
ncbi:hypothetical protein N7520_010258 [Penicillium odoratum]|uniref:uncharacterized protein n=1 Tax=Penicillium odoratum TaxID=1167516 RepID=UPI002546E1B3|nr:uncharacterized protein N7520_010258 [Penicillium odoratum]KAJ5745076.1 hypothetical protein N7520_010258 [Penicillium odoratum]